jgi:thioredoxin reductase (NADPH)
MAKPVILTVDDDPDVLRSIERDLRKRYSKDYRVMPAASGPAALELLARLEQRNETVALFLVDHRMPQMNGIEFLTLAMEKYPNARRVLLTAYADTEAAIRAINQVKLNHYLLKPWDPPDQNLYPVLDDLIEEWRAAFPPSFEGLRVMGTRWSPRCYELREFLARNHVPYRWLDVETAATDPEVRKYLGGSTDASAQWPEVIFPDGARISDPGPAELASRVGLRTHPDTDFYDLVIVGCGPAGLAAAVYGASEGLHTMIVDSGGLGGQAGQSSRIENYLGFPSGLSGSDLTRRAVMQARRFGTEILCPQEAVAVGCDGPYRIVTLSDNSRLSCHSLLLALGVQWRKLDVPGMERLNGAGVYYGAGPAEAMNCRGQDVYVVGGANSAGQAAMNFARYASRVVMLVRGESLAASMSKYLIDEIAATPAIEVQYGARIAEVHGADHLEAISIQCDRTGTLQTVPAGQLFIFIGAEPRTAWIDPSIERDERGFILTGRDLIRNGQKPKHWPLEREPYLLETSLPGVFAVGDVRHGSVKRVASGVGEGSIAIQFVHQYLAKV